MGTGSWRFVRCGFFDPHPQNNDGWVVTSHHNDILTYVDRTEVQASSSDLFIGLTGRAMRNQDAEELTVIHIEDKRKAR